jgi:hypothetical protein
VVNSLTGEKTNAAVCVFEGSYEIKSMIANFTVVLHYIAGAFFAAACSGMILRTHASINFSARRAVL